MKEKEEAIEAISECVLFLEALEKDVRDEDAPLRRSQIANSIVMVMDLMGELKKAIEGGEDEV